MHKFTPIFDSHFPIKTIKVKSIDRRIKPYIDLAIKNLLKEENKLHKKFESNLGIILLYAHIKNTSSSFLNKCFLGVDCKSAIHFFRLALENPDNPENTKISGLSRVSGVGLKKMDFRICFGRSKKSMAKKVWRKVYNFINTSSIRKTTFNPKIHSS